MTQHQLEEALCNQYDNGRYSPMGADGGALRYVLINVNGKTYNVSITLYSDIAKVRRIWALSEAKHDTQTGWTLNAKKLFDFTKDYYSVTN